LAGFVFDDPQAVDELVSQVSNVAGEAVGEVIADLMDVVQDQRGSALTIGLALAAFSASSIFLQVQGVLNLLFHVPPEHRRQGVFGWLVNRAVALASALVLSVIVLLPIAAVGAIGLISSLIPDNLAWLQAAARLVIPLVSLGLLTATVGITFQVLTSVKIPWKAASRGGAATAIAGLAAAYLVGLYLGQAGSSGTLGALGGLAILLFFFNLMWMVYVFGAEVTKTYSDYLDHGDVLQPSIRETQSRH
jgi:membrane protein